MAAKTFYWKNAVPSGATLHRSLQDGGSAPATAMSTTGWNPGTNAVATLAHCLQVGGTEVARTATTAPNWSTTAQPAQAPSQTRGDCWRSENPLFGTFASSNWVLTFCVRSVTAAFAGRGRLRVRVWRALDANGASATELTGATQTSNTTTANLSTTVDTLLTVTWTPGSTLAFATEYLFVQVAWETTTVGTAVGQDVDFRVGSAYTLVTPDFTPGDARTYVSWAQLEVPEPAESGSVELTQAAGVGAIGALTPETVNDSRASVAWVQLELPEAAPGAVVLTGVAAEGFAGVLVPSSVDLPGEATLTGVAAVGEAGVLVPSSVPTGGLPLGDEPWWMTRGGARKRKRDDDEEEERSDPPSRPSPEVITPPFASQIAQASGLLTEPPLPRKRYAPLRPIRSKQPRGNASPLSTDEDDEEVLLLLV